MSDVLVLDNISVELQGKQVLSGLSLSLKEGEILGLVGASGCGKTTCLNAIAGFADISAGQIELDNIAITTKAPLAPEKRNIGMIFQDYALFPHLSIERNICFGISKLAKAEQKQRVDELLALLNLEHLKDRYPHQLSGGQQQRVAIARALATRPKLLLLDEPFSNIDARLRNTLMVEMRQLLKQLKISAIFVTHNKDEVFVFADQIAVMYEGATLQKGAPADVCQKPNSWQVADFLQLGSWLPLQASASTCSWFISALGEIETNEYISDAPATTQQLLLKPQFITLKCGDGEKKNAKVDHITVTEQGYHYLLSGLTLDDNLSFEQLSVYSEQLLALDEQVVLAIKPHQYQLFSQG